MSEDGPKYAAWRDWSAGEADRLLSLSPEDRLAAIRATADDLLDEDAERVWRSLPLSYRSAPDDADGYDGLEDEPEPVEDPAPEPAPVVPIRPQAPAGMSRARISAKVAEFRRLPKSERHAAWLRAGLPTDDPRFGPTLAAPDPGRRARPLYSFSRGRVGSHRERSGLVRPARAFAIGLLMGLSAIAGFAAIQNSEPPRVDSSRHALPACDFRTVVAGCAFVASRVVAWSELAGFMGRPVASITSENPHLDARTPIPVGAQVFLPE